MAELGRLWAPCGYTSEVDTLRAVVLVRPADSLGAVRDAGASLMVDRIDLDAMRAQTAACADAYRDEGVTVHLVDPPPGAPPNVVFARDLFVMTPGGAVVARMASAQRAGEERIMASALAGLGVPIVRTVTGTATLEGADALWVDPKTVAVGVGFRTNRAGAAAMAGALREYGVRVTEVPLGSGVQHLLGSVVFVDDGVAVVHTAAATPDLRALLADRGYRVVELPPDEELVTARGMNLVTLRPGRVLMPTGAPGIRSRLAAAGIEAREVDVSQYVRAAGALGCLTGVLRRAR